MGDQSTGWHVTRNLSGKPAHAYFDFHWQRGQLGFELFTPEVLAGQEQQSDAENLAEAIDAIEQTRPPPSIGSPTVTPPVTEAQRLQAALKLKLFPLPESATPPGFGSGTPYYLDAAGFVAESNDPATELQLVDQNWKNVITERQLFTSR